MNKLLPLLCPLLFLISCKQLDKLTQFEIEYNETVVVPSSTGINLPFNFSTPDIETNSESKFSVNNTRKDLIEEIILKSLNMKLSSPENKDFSFLESISVYMSADGLSETKIAWKENIPSNIGNSLDLETTGDNLKEYIIKDEFSLRVNTVTDELLSTDHYIDIHTVFFVDATSLN